MNSVDWTSLGYTDGYEAGVADASPQRMVREFHKAFGLAVDAEDTPELRLFRVDLIDEEYEEVLRALVYGDQGAAFPGKSPGTLEDVAKELADLVIVTYGTAASLGIDLDEAVRRVHDSNMTKVDDNGNPLFREDGKLLKGPNYEPPDMSGVVRER